MKIIKLSAALGALVLSSAAIAQTHFECGSVACSAFGSAPITAIDDVSVDGHLFDVTFSDTQSNTFVFSQYQSTPGHPLTGIDAANALDAFYATQKGPYPQDDGPGIFAKVNGVDSVVFNIVTAYAPTKTPGITDIDVTEPFLGISAPGETEAVAVDSRFLCSQFATCAVWTPVSAPEISLVSTTSALTLLLGSLAVLRGRRAGPPPTA
jgi:hypothetical protein